MSARNIVTSNVSPISSPRGYTNIGLPGQQQNLSANQVSRIVGVAVRQGQKIKGQSRISYIPYEKKITQYEERQVVQRVPVKRKVVQYEQRKVVQEVPRQVVTTDYYAVENIKQYYKEVIPEKKIQYVPIEKKVKRVEYIPVQKQIVHYPQGQDYDYAKGQSRVILQRQGVTVRPDAEYRQIDPTLIYNYSSQPQHRHNPVGYVEDGFQRNLSTAPTQILQQQYQQGYYTGPPSQTSIYGVQQTYSPRGNQGTYSTFQDINVYPY